MHGCDLGVVVRNGLVEIPFEHLLVIFRTVTPSGDRIQIDLDGDDTHVLDVSSHDWLLPGELVHDLVDEHRAGETDDETHHEVVRVLSGGLDCLVHDPPIMC